ARGGAAAAAPRCRGPARAPRRRSRGHPERAPPARGRRAAAAVIARPGRRGLNTAGAGAALEALAERARALRGGAVGPGLGLHAALGLALDRVVADLGRRVERLVDVADLELVAALRVPGPRARQAVGLKLGRNRADLAATEEAAQVLDVVANLVCDHVRLCEIARRAKPAAQHVVERQVDVDLAVDRAVERDDRGRGATARRRD